MAHRAPHGCRHGRGAVRATTALATLIDRHRGRVAVLLVIAAGLYFTIAFGNQAWRANQLQAQVDGQRAAIAAITGERSDLEAQQAALSGDAYDGYAQRVARRDLNLANPGETLILVHWESPPPSTRTNQTEAAPSPAPEQPNWRSWLDIFSGD